MTIEEPACAYCGEGLEPDGVTCGGELCVREYWKELNAESLRGG